MLFQRIVRAFVVLILFVWAAVPPASIADVLKSAQECRIGARVATSDGHQGTITRVDHAWQYCYVRQDDTGREVGYLYSLLQANDEPPAITQLTPGIYVCKTGGIYAFTDIRILGATSYTLADKPGQYHIEPSGQIVFETGPLSGRFSRILSTTRIGLGADGEAYFRTICDLS